MSDDGEVNAVTENNLMDALKVVLKKAMIHDGLVRGLRECAKALDRKEAHLCIMATDCDNEPYKNLIHALCKTYNVNLVEVSFALFPFFLFQSKGDEDIFVETQPWFFF